MVPPVGFEPTFHPCSGMKIAEVILYSIHDLCVLDQLDDRG